MKKYLLLFISIYFMQDYLLAQTGAEGNLLRFKFDAVNIYPGDTVGKWKSISWYGGSYWRERYTDHISTAKHNYLIKTIKDSNPIMYEGIEFRIYNENTGSDRPISGGGRMVDMPFPDYHTLLFSRVLDVNNGRWLMGYWYGSYFITENDSIILPSNSSQNGFTIAAGKVDNKYLLVFNKSTVMLADLPNAPNINISNAQEIEYSDNMLPVKVVQLSSDLYLSQTSSTEISTSQMKLYQFKNGVMNYIRTFFNLDNYIMKDFGWEYRNNTLYILQNRTLGAYKFNSQDTTFSEKQTLLSWIDETSTSVDRELKYAAMIHNDSISIYSIDKKSIINTLSLKGIDSPSNAVIDSPYVYIHKVTKHYTLVDDQQTDKFKYGLKQNYPNPFNPTTTISYSIAKQSHVELKIYDMLGREIVSLLSKEENAGDYKVNFDGSALPSGIYLYRIHRKPQDDDA